MSYMSSPFPQKARHGPYNRHQCIISIMAETHQATHQGSSKAYHHRHVISIMAPRPSPSRSSNARASSSSRSSIIMYIRSSSSQLDQAPQELHHIIKIKQSSSNQLDHGLHHLQGLHHQQASSRHLQYGSMSIIIMSKHNGLHHIIRVLMG